MDILKKINKMRIDRNWSIYRLSVESGVSQSTLTNMFNRETLPSITTLECICNAFEITMAEFFEDKECVECISEEKEIINLYHSISSSARKTILELLRELAK